MTTEIDRKSAAPEVDDTFTASPWVDDTSAALLTDLYELTMLQAYWREGLDRTATFSLFFRRMPAQRNYLLTCGLDCALRYLERLRFGPAALAHLGTLLQFQPAFLDWLGQLRFTGDVYAMPEGTPVFPDEPFLEVVAPLAQAQIVESFVMNQIHFATLAASKAARVVEAAAGRTVVDFGMRRVHGTDAAVKSARAFYIAGVAATSNVLAGQIYGIPVTGTMAHSYIQAHDRELDAFRGFAALYPETTLLVDTYDTLGGIRHVIALARELGDAFRVRAVRLDSGDLGELARQSRRLLDEAGLGSVQILASGGLDEYGVAALVERGAPIDGFGVGTRMGVSRDVPDFDIAYKMVALGDSGRLKLSTGKHVLPGRKQVFRVEERGEAVRDAIALHHERLPGRPLLRQVMAGGRRLETGSVSLDASRAHAREELSRLPARLRSLERAAPPYAVAPSAALDVYRREVSREVTARSE